MRRVSSILIIIFLILSGFGLTILFDFTSQNASADIYIDTDTPWSGTKIIDGNVYIRGGVTLTINPGTIVIFNGNYNIIVNDTGKLDANGGDSINQQITFHNETGSTWGAIKVQDRGYANLDWCVIENSTNGIWLDRLAYNTNYRTTVTNCSFNNCSSYFRLTKSNLNVTSTKFEGAQFNDNLADNLKNLTLDGESKLYIQYFVNINTMDGLGAPLENIQVDIQENPFHSLSSGKTDAGGQFLYNPVTDIEISGTTPKADFQYIANIDVKDKWSGTGVEIIDISNQSTIINNASTEPKNKNLHIQKDYIFNYPPIIDDIASNIKVKEDKSEDIMFVFHDNDDFKDGNKTGPAKFDGITINITDPATGYGIYNDTGSPNTKNKYIIWSNKNGGELRFYRTVESPSSPLPPDDYDATVIEYINITISDGLGQKAWTGDVLIEFQNVPDKPEIKGLPWAQNVTVVTEDVPTYLDIIVSDDDNDTAEIDVYSNSEYVNYIYSPTSQSLELLFENEFGNDSTQEQIDITATDGCSDPVMYSFFVNFKQTSDPPVINGTIPNWYGNESIPSFEFSLGQYASDPDPDDNYKTLKWYVTGVDEELFGKRVFDVSEDTMNATANTPLSFSLNPELDLGGAQKPKMVEDKIQIWLKDKDGNTTSQEISLFVNSTNQPPSLYKIDKGDSKITVEPASGVSSDTYRFQIEYRDLDGEKGDAPAIGYPKVYIDDEPNVMVEVDPSDDNYKDGKLYYYQHSSLSAGSHEHYFECSDGDLITRLPKENDKPNNISLPDVVSRVYILRRESLDHNFVVRLAHTSPLAFANVADASKPSTELEPDKDEFNKTKGDIGAYFQIETDHIDSLLWAELSIQFGLGSDYADNYNDTKWLRKVDMEFGYYTAAINDWTSIYSEMSLGSHILMCNITEQYTLASILASTDKPVFTVIGELDADNDGHYNAKDAFPFDPAASLDSDKDGSPDKWNHQGMSEKDSTTGLHIDAFKYDPAASLDDDNDKCPDEWNVGKNQNDSTSVPKLTLDHFPDNPGACLDTDGDGMPDKLDKLRDTKNLIEDKDDDNDDMPDDWEEQYGLDPKDPHDADEDKDGDGRSNLEEYRKGTDPNKKDAEEGILSSFMMILIIIIVIVVIVIVLGFILRKRGKKEPEDLPRGMGGPPPEPEGGEEALPPETEAYAPAPETEQLPGEPPGDALGFEDQAQTQVLQDEGILTEGEVPVGESLPTQEAMPPTEEPATLPPVDEEQMTPPELPVQESIEIPAQLSASEPDQIAPAPPPETTEGIETAEEQQFTCPNCGTALTRDMTQCPGCAAPLAFD